MKQGNRLYGTNFKVLSPKILKDKSAVAVILKVANYKNEIKTDIINNINTNVTFWEQTLKIAYTINGLIGGFVGKNSIQNDKSDRVLILKYISDILNKNICSVNDVDFFLFSWHLDMENEFNELFNPPISIIPLPLLLL